MSEAGLIGIHTGSVAVIQEFAQLSGVRPSEFINQSLRLGVYLTGILITAPREPSMLFEQPDGSYNQYPIAFPEVVSANVGAEPLEDGIVDPDLEKPETLLVAVDPRLHSTTADIAAEFGIRHESYLHTGVFLRWQWALTRSSNGLILVDDGKGASDEYVVHDDDRVLERIVLDEG